MLLRTSKWRFSTSNSAGASVGLVGSEGGSVTLLDPEGKSVKFAYGALGASIGKGIQLPKIGKVQIPGIAGSSELFESKGLVLLAPTFQGSELSAQDICGACCFVEFAAGVVWGEGVYAMTFGMNPAAFAAVTFVPATAMRWILQSLKGYLLFRGTNFGLQGGASAASYVGYMRMVS
jgi:hypothetical protein